MPVHAPFLLAAIAAIEVVASLSAPLPARALRLSAAPLRPPPDARQAVVVGGGPAGLAAAITLARRGFRKVVVLERGREGEDDIDKSFVFRVDARGQRFTDWCGVTDELVERGVPLALFQSNLLENRPKPQGLDGSVERPARASRFDWRRFLLGNQAASPKKREAAPPQPTARGKVSVFIRRPEFVGLLRKHIRENYRNEIDIRTGIEVLDITRVNPAVDKPVTPSPRIRVAARAREAAADALAGPTFELFPDLVVGADGYRSVVRDSMRGWYAEDVGPRAAAKNPFDMRKYPSGSTGLQYKVLLIPARFPLDHSLTSLAEPQSVYTMVGVLKGRRRRLRLGITPATAETVAATGGRRTANFISWPDHELFACKTGEEVLCYLETALPHLPIRAMVPPVEAERFATSRGGRFVAPQCPESVQWVLRPVKSDQTAAAAAEASTSRTAGSAAGLATAAAPRATGAAGRSQIGVESGAAAAACGMVLVGDAMHSFPPDLGVGVNAALEDVMVLRDCLIDGGDRLDVALPLYQKIRVPDAYALVRLSERGFPWQYQHNLLRLRLWTLSFLFRQILHKLFPGWFPPPFFLLLSDPKRRFSDIWEGVRQANFRLARVAALVAAVAALAMVKRALVGSSAGLARLWYAVGL